MKRIAFILLSAGLLFWMLGNRNHTVTLPALAPGDAVSLSTPPALQASDAREIVEARIPDAEMDYYSVSGSTVADLRNSLDSQHPVSGFDGNTHWHVSWNWPGYGSPDCDLQSAKLDTAITVTLPRWNPPRDASTELILQWKHYLGSLAFHEQGHVQLARQGFARMQQVLHDADCGNAEARLQGVMQIMHEADRRYDADTDHGTRQGARFP